jgi:transposase-like protein
LTKKKSPSEKTGKRGRPPAYKPEFHPKLVLELAEQGKTNEEIAESLGISTPTLWVWAKKYPEFLSALKEGKDQADKGAIKTLYQRAMGWKITEKKVIQNPDGSKRMEITEKEIPPDTTALIFWLKNRRPQEWRDKHEQEITGKDGTPLPVPTIPPASLKIIGDILAKNPK